MGRKKARNCATNCNQWVRFGFAHRQRHPRCETTALPYSCYGDLSKFIRPEEPRRGQITDRDLDILACVLRYRFISAAQLVRLVGGNEDVTHRRLRALWEWQLLNRWAFPGIRTHSEFYYYLDCREVLNILAERRGLELNEQILAEVRNNRDKDYAGAVCRGQHMQLGFLKHELMLSRLHFCLELACKKSHSQIDLAAWVQGASLAGHKVEVPTVKSTRLGNDYGWDEAESTERLPVEPDAMFTLRFADRSPGQDSAHFFYEADRGSMTMTDMLKKFRGYYHFVKRQQKHKETFGIHPVRALLIETTNEARARRLMQLVQHPLVCGNRKRTGLFWFSISSVFMDLTMRQTGDSSALPGYLHRPETVFDRIWALPEATMHALGDAEN